MGGAGQQYIVMTASLNSVASLSAGARTISRTTSRSRSRKGTPSPAILPKIAVLSSDETSSSVEPLFPGAHGPQASESDPKKPVSLGRKQ